jgi:hypothetical protein
MNEADLASSPSRNRSPLSSPVTLEYAHSHARADTPTIVAPAKTFTRMGARYGAATTTPTTRALAPTMRPNCNSSPSHVLSMSTSERVSSMPFKKGSTPGRNQRSTVDSTPTYLPSAVIRTRTARSCSGKKGDAGGMMGISRRVVPGGASGSAGTEGSLTHVVSASIMSCRRWSETAGSSMRTSGSKNWPTSISPWRGQRSTRAARRKSRADSTRSGAGATPPSIRPLARNITSSRCRSNRSCSSVGEFGLKSSPICRARHTSQGTREISLLPFATG